MIGFIAAMVIFYDGGRHRDGSQNLASVISTQATHTATIENRTNGLYVIRNGQETIITIRKDNLTEPVYGTHVNIFAASVSPNGRYVHYCEQQFIADYRCLNRIYDSEVPTVSSVKEGESWVYSDISSIDSNYTYWHQNGRLIIGDLISDTATKPWRMNRR